MIHHSTFQGRHTEWSMVDIDVFSGGGGRDDDIIKTPSPYEQLLPLPTPFFNPIQAGAMCQKGL